MSCLVVVAAAADALPLAFRGLDCADYFHQVILFRSVAWDLMSELCQRVVQLPRGSQGIDGALPAQVFAGCNHPNGEVVVRDPQFQRVPE